MKLHISVANLLALKEVSQKVVAAELSTTQGVISKKPEDPKWFIECEVKCKALKYSDSPLYFVRHPNVSDKDRRAFFHRKVDKK